MKKNAVPVFAAVLFAVLVASGIHGFSTGCWNDLVPDTLPSYSRRALGVRHLVWSGRKLREPWLKYEGRSRLHFVYTVLPEEASTAPSPDGP